MSDPTQEFVKWASVESTTSMVAECRAELERLKVMNQEAYESLSAKLALLCRAAGVDARPLTSPATAPAKDPPRPESDDLVVRRDPPRWTGEKYVGQPISQVPTAYLIALRDYRRWGVDNDAKKGTEQGNKYADWGRQDLKKIEAEIERRVAR